MFFDLIGNRGRHLAARDYKEAAPATIHMYEAGTRPPHRGHRCIESERARFHGCASAIET
jgi:hypothetical protein